MGVKNPLPTEKIKSILKNIPLKKTAASTHISVSVFYKNALLKFPFTSKRS